MTSSTAQTSFVRRLVVSEILIVVLLVAAYAAFKRLEAQKAEVEPKAIETARLNVDVFLAESLVVQELLTGFGTARADRDVVVAAQVSGEIVDFNPQLKVGQRAQAGQLIAVADQPSMRRDADLLLKIDPRDLQQRADQAASAIDEGIAEIDRLKVQQANLVRQLENSRATLATLQEEYDRVLSAETKKAATRSDLNRALLEVQRYQDAVIQLENQVSSIPLQLLAAEQRLASSRAEQSRARNDLQRTEVYPPFDGVISDVFVQKGRYVRAGEQLVRLTDISRVEVPVSLGMDDFLQLQQILNGGQKPKVLLAENETADTRWSGYMVRVAPEADSLSRTIQVYVEVDNSPEQTSLLPGTFTYAKIEGQIFSDVVLVPQEAIVDGAVFVVNEANVVRKQSIKTGRRFQSLVLVEEGLAAGERVVLTNLDIVEEGKEVIVQSTIGPRDETDALRSPTLRIIDPSNP